MPLVNQVSAARTSLIYLTVGAITTVWTVIWLVYYLTNPPAGDMFYFVFGFMATGLVLVAIGLGVGSIGRSAKDAEPPPAVVVATPAAPVQAPVQAAPPPLAAAAVPMAAQNVQPVVTQNPPVAAYARERS